MIRSVALMASAALMLAACSPARPDNVAMPVEDTGIVNDTAIIDPGAVPNAQESVESNAIAPFPDAGNVATTEAYIDLSRVQPADMSVITGNVGGCMFEDAQGRALLFVGVPDDRRANPIGAARQDGQGIRLTGVGSGIGYVDKGPVMKAGALTLTLRRDPGEGKSVGIETREWPADLIATDTDGNKRTYGGGSWACGV